MQISQIVPNNLCVVDRFLKMLMKSIFLDSICTLTPQNSIFIQNFCEI